MRSIKKYKFSNKQPIDLTSEELLELANQITTIEYLKRNDITKIQTSEDAAQEILTYAYEKQARGKNGIDKMKELSMPHFINTLHLETRNSINYITRKKKSQVMIYDTISIDQPLDGTESDNSKTIKDTISDESYIEQSEINYELENILSNIDDTKNEKLIIKYGHNNHKTEQEFSYRNLARLYFNLCDDKKIRSKDLQGILFDKKTGLEIDESQIKKIMRGFSKYIKNNHILGGI